MPELVTSFNISRFSIIFKTIDCTIDLAPFCDLKLFLEAHSAEATRCLVLYSEQSYTCVRLCGRGR